MPTSTEIRQQFIDFFCQKHGHTFVPSSPVVPLDDPTLLFANAGMNQFKPYFLGTEKPPYKRAANTQKCIRAGGKHNDLDDVGKDTYHHTFFEMLGNWSFGDYFKKEAIAWAWELLTQVWKLDPSRLHVTVFEGDTKNHIPRDDEAAGYWRAVGVPDSHIHLGNKKDNFWEMGATGPCGPCTEIHYDSTPDKSGAHLVNQSSDQVVEIWNNVFIQFNRNEDQSLTPLPAQHVDTGMGFERITKVLQGKSSNYDTDIFTPIFDAIRDVTKAPAYGGKLDDLKDTAYRVIADHIRTLTFSLTDGATIGNEGRDYVLRRILRRAERYGRQVLGTKEPFLHNIMPVVIERMGDVFPELRRNPEKVRAQIYEEEQGFLRTLDRGIRRVYYEAETALIDQYCKEYDVMLVTGGSFNDPEDDRPLMSGYETRGLTTLKFTVAPSASDELSQLQRIEVGDNPRDWISKHLKSTPVISGRAAFRLHDTDGFLIDITTQMAEEMGLAVDAAGFEEEMEKAKQLSRASGKKHTVEAVKGELPKTDDTPKYRLELASAKVLGWIKDNEVIRSGSLKPGANVALLLDRTNFYAEQGGQVGDAGSITSDAGVEFAVETTQRFGDGILHVGSLRSGELKVGDAVRLMVGAARPDTMRHHTATHLMNLALREVLGDHVEQKGSLVDADKTRFDFSHDKPLSPDEIRAIEQRVNDAVAADLPVAAVTMPLAEARNLPGVRAVFGEKYPDPVRVVMVGAETPAAVAPGLSVEFCGGTHVPRTGGIGYFKIVEQGAVAKGIRRVTAVTGRASQELIRKTTGVVDDLTTRFRCKVDELPGRIDALQAEVKKLQDQLKKGTAGDLAGVADKLLADAPTVGGSKLIVGQLPAAPAEAVRAQAERLRQKAESALIVLGSVDDEGKVALVVAVSSDLTAKGVKAGDLIKPLAEVVGGRGGGKPDIAQAGGKDAAKLPDAIKKAEELGRSALS